MKRINDTLRQQVAEMSRNGMSYNQIKQETGLGKGTISSICQQINGKKEYLELTPEKITELQALYDEVGNIKTVAKMYKISYERLSKVIQLKEPTPKTGYQCIKDRRHKVKEYLISYKGGKCQICGYSRCRDAMDFHHIDSSTKTFSISNSNIYKNMEKMKQEVDKCMLVCANCHREIHAGIIDIQDYL